MDLDGTGSADVSTGVPFFDHMLNQLGKHGCIDLRAAAATPRSTPTTRSRTPRSRLARRCARRSADKAGICRFGDALVPLDETLVRAAVDLAGRPYVVHSEPDGMPPLIGSYDTSLTRHFFETLARRPRSACT